MRTKEIHAPDTARPRTNTKIPFSSPAIRSPAGPKGGMRVKEHSGSKAEQDGRRFLFACALQGMGGQEILAKLPPTESRWVLIAA